MTLLFSLCVFIGTTAAVTTLTTYMVHGTDLQHVPRLTLGLITASTASTATVGGLTGMGVAHMIAAMPAIVRAIQKRRPHRSAGETHP